MPFTGPSPSRTMVEWPTRTPGTSVMALWRPGSSRPRLIPVLSQISRILICERLLVEALVYSQNNSAQTTDKTRFAGFAPSGSQKRRGRARKSGAGHDGVTQQATDFRTLPLSVAGYGVFKIHRVMRQLSHGHDEGKRNSEINRPGGAVQRTGLRMPAFIRVVYYRHFSLP